jgi:hypothetical protein
MSAFHYVYRFDLSPSHRFLTVWRTLEASAPTYASFAPQKLYVNALLMQTRHARQAALKILERPEGYVLYENPICSGALRSGPSGMGLSPI